MKNRTYPQIHFHPVTSFKKLGSGRQRKQVVVVDSVTREILGIWRISRNHHSHREIYFDNLKRFDMNSKAISGRSVLLYLYSDHPEQWQYPFDKQCRIDGVVEWMNRNAPEQIFALAETVEIVTRKPLGICKDSYAVPWAKDAIVKRCEEEGTSLKDLDDTCGALYAAPEKTPAKSDSLAPKGTCSTNTSEAALRLRVKHSPLTHFLNT